MKGNESEAAIAYSRTKDEVNEAIFIFRSLTRPIFDTIRSALKLVKTLFDGCRRFMIALWR
jgi:hypothetical protein